MLSRFMQSTVSTARTNVEYLRLAATLLVSWNVSSLFVPLVCLYRCMVFGHKSSSQYLVTASETHLQVWDLLSCSGEHGVW